MIFLSSNHSSGAEIKDVNREKTPLLETKSVRAAPKQSPGESEFQYLSKTQKFFLDSDDMELPFLHKYTKFLYLILSYKEIPLA